MNIKGMFVALLAGLSVSTAAAAAVTVHHNPFIADATNFNGFEGISAPFWAANAVYSEDGVDVQYVGPQLFTTTVLKSEGDRSWAPLGGGYTKISLTNGSDFDAIQFLAGTKFMGVLRYELRNNGALLGWGSAGSLGNAFTSLKTFGFSGGRFDEIRLSNPMALDFAVIDSISISAVPEPATWAMMIIGFGAVGSMVRSSRRRQAFAFA
jgi:hypothetical protein